MNDEELDKACNFLLQGLRELNPNLAKELTKAIKNPKYRSLSKIEKKITKIRLLREKDEAIISEIFAAENAAWAREPRSDIPNFFYLLERRAASLNPYGERTGGNYSTDA